MLLTELTPEQKARLPEIAEEWTRIGLCTDPADRPRAEKAVCDMYAQADLAPPHIVWCTSPFAQGVVRWLVTDMASVRASVRASVLASVRASIWASVRASVWDSVWDSVGDSVGDSVRASVWDSVWDSVRASVGASVRTSVRASVLASVGDSVRASVLASVWDSVWASVRASVRASVWDSVWDSVGDSVGDSVRASVWDSVWDSVRASVGASVRTSVRASVLASVGDSVRASVLASVWDSVYGSHDAAWLAFHWVFREFGLVDETRPIKGLWELAKSAGWALPHEHICWISERHNVLHRDEQGRLHCPDGLACAYPDGWGVYAWHGVRVPADVILRPQDLTAERVRDERSAEIRRVMMERFGMDRWLDAIGAQPVQTDRFGELFVLDGFTLPLVRVVNSTPEPDGTYKRYVLTATRDCLTAHDAVASTFGLTSDNYDPVIET